MKREQKRLALNRTRALLFALAGTIVFGLVLAPPASAQAPASRVIEEIVARVNNEIVTRGELRRALTTAENEVREECKECAPEELERRLGEARKRVLRDLIDQSLMVQRAKDLGINVETELIRTLDQIRQRNNLPDMEALESAVNASGIIFEDWRNQMRNRMLTQELIRREVIGTMKIGKDELEGYYNEHKDEFVRPEMVFLSEIFLTTDGKTEEEIAEIEARAKALVEQCRQGGDFHEIARRTSTSVTAERGGELGGYERGQLAKELEDVVFTMRRGQVTDAIRTQTGFLILRVDERFEPGLQPLDKVEGEIMNRIYQRDMDTSLRKYLDELRAESYVYVKPAYADGAGLISTLIQEMEPEPEPEAKKKRKRFIIF
jgi:peptidyl-prolyl cis-trans isomerase SurA